jgi:hypothetical protein
VRKRTVSLLSSSRATKFCRNFPSKRIKSTGAARRVGHSGGEMSIGSFLEIPKQGTDLHTSRNGKGKGRAWVAPSVQVSLAASCGGLLHNDIWYRRSCSLPTSYAAIPDTNHFIRYRAGIADCLCGSVTVSFAPVAKAACTLDAPLPSGFRSFPRVSNYCRLPASTIGKPAQGGTCVFVIQVTDSSTPPISVAYCIPPRTEADRSTR